MKKRFFAALLCLFSLILSAEKYPPNLRWLEIGRDDVTIIFPAGRHAEAVKALNIATALNAELANFWRFRPSGRIRIVIDDSTDQANGFATFHPFNLVGISLAEPPPDSEIFCSRNWIDLVLAHELTHIFSLNAGAPLFRFGRRLFGSLPILYPAAQMPPWVVEGLAVEEESRLTGDGRLNHAPYRLMLDAARRDELFPNWSRIAGAPTAWPGPTGKYLFGAGFMEFLADRYGSGSLRRYVERFSTRLLTLGASRDFRKLFGRPLGELWDEYREGKNLLRRSAVEPLTKDGFVNRFPCFLVGGALVYYHRDYRGRGEVRLLDPTRDERSLFKMDAVNAIAGGGEDKLLLSATELYRSFNDYSDLYEYDLKKNRLQRLSKGKRLSYPITSGEASWIYCVERRNNRSRLALFDSQRGEARSISMAFAGMAQLSISPDGSRIAAAAKPAGGPWGIAVFQPSGTLENFLSVEGNDLSQPRWHGSGRLLFIASDRNTSFLAVYSRDAGGAWRLDEQRLTGVRQFDLSNDGKEILFTYDSGNGEKIAKATAEWIPESPIGISVAAEIPETPTTSTATASIPFRPYRFWRDLLPRWWSPALLSGGDELQAGIATGGQDALGVHRYNVEGYYGFSSRRANILFQYIYDGLLPTLSVQYRDTNDYYRGSRNSLRTKEFTFASLWPLRIRKRSRLHAYADLHLEKRTHIDRGNEFALGDMMNGIRLGMRFNSARAWYDSLSPADGVTLAVQGAVHPAGLGNELASHALQADARAYLPLFRPGVLALRLAAAKNWESASHYYDMGGAMAEDGLGSNRPFRLLRGFETGSFYGNRGWQFNAECRLPLLRTERALLPAVSCDRLWLALFFDAGCLASRSRVTPIVYSLGTEAALRLTVGGTTAVDLALGFAQGFGPERTHKLYLRTGRSF